MRKSVSELISNTIEPANTISLHKFPYTKFAGHNAFASAFVRTLFLVLSAFPETDNLSNEFQQKQPGQIDLTFGIVLS